MAVCFAVVNYTIIRFIYLSICNKNTEEMDKEYERWVNRLISKIEAHSMGGWIDWVMTMVISDGCLVLGTSLFNLPLRNTNYSNWNRKSPLC